MLDLRGAISAVCEGRNGRLFLGRQDGFDLSQFTAPDALPQGLIDQWRATLSRRARELAARGVPYVFFIVPDAPSVHPEDLPAALGRPGRPLGEQFLDAVGDIEGVTFVYPLNAMRQAAGGLEIYKKKDSHWTTFGSYVAYRDLMRHLQALVACHVVRARDVSFTFRRAYGDLGSLTEPEQAEEIPVHSISGPGVTMLQTLEGAGRQTCTEVTAEGDLPPCRALFFRDSYMTDLSPYLARSFAHFMTIGTTTRVLLDAVDNWHADLVVSQVAERKLLFAEPDHQLDDYATMFGANFRSPEGALLLKASLLKSQDPAQAASLIAGIGDAFAAHPMHAYAASLIHEANGDIESAGRFIRAAVRLQPDQPSFLALAGRVALGAGRLQDAVDYTGKAAAAAPYNGYFHELHVYCLVQAHDFPAALAAADAALARITDSANLWFWGSVCHEASGQPAQAHRYIEQALRLVPGDAAYEAHRAKITVAAV